MSPYKHLKRNPSKAGTKRNDPAWFYWPDAIRLRYFDYIFWDETNHQNTHYETKRANLTGPQSPTYLNTLIHIDLHLKEYVP